MKLVFFLLLLSLSGNEPSEKEISYRLLTWSDYRGTVPENEPDVAARTMTQLAMETTEKDGKYYFRVRAYFLPDSSFVRVRSDRNLRHEQTHFKITCIEAKRCMLSLERLQGGNSLAASIAGTLYSHCYDQSSLINDQFDQETNHGLDLEQEKIWEDQISHEMLIFGNPSRFMHGRNR